MKIAIFGGSFNPVHNEHINIVKAAIRALSLDKVIVMPTFVTPAKSGTLCAAAQDRLNLCRIAFSGIDGVEVSDSELKRGGVSYTYLTCREMRERYPKAELYFIVGADMLENFYLWKNPEEILSHVTLAACAREDGAYFEKALISFKAKFGEKVVPFGYVGGAVSSTKIRTLCAFGEACAHLMPPEAEKYVKKAKIYSIPQIEGVKNLLTEQRYAHTLRVAVMAAENCRRVCVDEITAITAAALHDCAKYLKAGDKLLKGFICPEGVPEAVAHQYAGAYVAENYFGVTDAEILNAIKYHTSGRANMRPLEKLIYLCDLLEEGRNFAGVEALRAIFKKDIDDCLFAALSHQVEYLKASGAQIYPLTEQAYEYLKEEKNDK